MADFVGVVAPTKHLATQAIEAIAATAKWEHPEHPASSGLYDHLNHTGRGVPANPNAEAMTSAAKTVQQEYHVAYARHAANGACARRLPSGMTTN